MQICPVSQARTTRETPSRSSILRTHNHPHPSQNSLCTQITTMSSLQAARSISVDNDKTGAVPARGPKVGERRDRRMYVRVLQSSWPGRNARLFA